MARNDQSNPNNDIATADTIDVRAMKRRLWGAYYAARKNAEACPTPGELCACTVLALDAQAAVVDFAHHPAVIAAATPST